MSTCQLPWSSTGGNGQCYGYDANSNITYQPGRGASITYNYLNLPRQIQLNGKTLVYTYDTGATSAA